MKKSRRCCRCADMSTSQTLMLAITAPDKTKSRLRVANIRLLVRANLLSIVLCLHVTSSFSQLSRWHTIRTEEQLLNRAGSVRPSNFYTRFRISDSSDLKRATETALFKYYGYPGTQVVHSALLDRLEKQRLRYRLKMREVETCGFRS